MTKLLYLFFIVAVTACNSQTKKQIGKNASELIEKQEPIDKFWKWFQANEKELRSFEQHPDKTLTEVLDSARKIQSGLAIEFEPPKNNVVNVTISADGDRNLFPVVKAIVEKAPKIAGWNFIAFRQRMQLDKIKGMALTAQGSELNPDKIKFFPVVSGDSLDIIIYMDNVTEENYNQVGYAGLVLIDNILGEYDCVTKVRHYDFQNMPTRPDELKDLKPLLDLPNYVDQFYKSTHS